MEKFKKSLLYTLAVFSLGCCVGIHRRVILAWIKGEPMPEAPAWHFWVKKK